MQKKTFDRLLLFSLFFMAYWFFGNLYEEIVMVPNQLSNTFVTLKHYQGYFTVSNPTYYFVPFTQIAVIVLWFLYFNVKNVKEKLLLKKASIFGLLAIITTIIIVTQINIKIFEGNLEEQRESLYTFSLYLLLGNAIRLFFVGGALYYIFKTYILRQYKD